VMPALSSTRAPEAQSAARPQQSLPRDEYYCSCLTADMDAHRFADRYPRSFHMADENSWPSIRRHGFLSAAAIVVLVDPPRETRHSILNGPRLTSIELDDKDLGSIAVRDQLPLKFLNQFLHDGVWIAMRTATHLNF
jgi:hypothetical protein